jgi:hypothetical protein
MKENNFMNEYEKIVKETMELCKRKNQDYGCSVQDTYEKFGDLSYLTRIADKFNRLCTLITNKEQAVDESIDDTIKDLGNYAFLWMASRSLNKEKED